MDVLPRCQNAAEADDQDALARFARILAGSRAPTTVRLYVSYARRWLAAGGRCDRLDRKVLMRWLGDMRRAHARPTTINQAIKSLRAFYGAMYLIGAAPADEARHLPRLRRVPTQPVRALDDVQMERLLAQPDLSTFAGVRDAVMIRALWETGLRASELLGLAVGDVLPDLSLYVACGKGGRSRYVEISAELHEQLRAYMLLRGARRVGKTDALWISERGRPIRARQTVWRIVSSHARAALGGAVWFGRIRRQARQRPWTGHYPHLVRASFATTLLRHGCPLPAIQQLLGHASLDSTARYLGVDMAQLRAAMAKHPRAHASAPSPLIDDPARRIR